MAETTEAPDFDLRAHLRALWRRRGLIAAVVLLIVGSTLIASVRQTSIYQGDVKVILQPGDTESLFDAASEEQADPARAVETEIEVVKSEPVEAAVRKQVGSVSRVSVSQVGATDIIKISAQSDDPKKAAAAARAYAIAYIDFRRSQAIQDINEAARKIDAKVGDLQRQIDALDSQIARATPDIIPGRPVPQGQLSLVQGLSARRDQMVAQQALFKQRLDELQVEAELKTGGAQLVTRREVPVSKVSPTPLRSSLVALAVGLVLGAGLAFLVEYLDDSLRTKDELARAVPAVPVLGVIPAVSRGRRSAPEVVSVREPHALAAEAYRGLRTALQFLGVQRTPRVFEVTSTGGGEGKTSTVSNLGVVMAKSGQRVVMVDCDLRLARLHEFFGLPNTVGFTSVFLNEASLSDATQAIPGVENLWLLSSGALPPNPSEMLSGRRTAELVAVLQDLYDVVLIDCPPVLPVSDSIGLSAWVDAVLVVTRAGRTRAKDLQRSVELLRQAEAPVVGTVLNAVSTPDTYGYTYPYQARPPSRRFSPGSRAPSEGRPAVTPAFADSSERLGGADQESPLS